MSGGKGRKGAKGEKGRYIAEDGGLDEVSLITETIFSKDDFSTSFLPLLNRLHNMIMLNFIHKRCQSLMSATTQPRKTENDGAKGKGGTAFSRGFAIPLV